MKILQGNTIKDINTIKLELNPLKIRDNEYKIYLSYRLYINEGESPTLPSERDVINK